jgi:hypothetical protein
MGKIEYDRDKSGVGKMPAYGRKRAPIFVRLEAVTHDDGWKSPLLSSRFIISQS